MKKIILVPALLGVMGIGGALALYGENLTGVANTDKTLTLEQVEQKALKEVNGTIRDIEYDRNAIRSYYEVEVIATDAEYDLKFDAVTGELLSKRKDFLDYDDVYEENYYKNNVTPTQTSTPTTVTEPKAKQAPQQNTATVQPKAVATTPSTQAMIAPKITEQQATQIALGQVKGTVTWVELDDDNEYDIEIVNGQDVYEFEINASTGTITQMERDGFDD